MGRSALQTGDCMQEIVIGRTAFLEDTVASFVTGWRLARAKKVDMT
jgi:hypothetical protein